MTSVVSSVLSVFEAIGSFFVTTFGNITELFYTTPTEGGGGGLTFIGTLALIGLGMSVILLIINMIRRWVKRV